MPNYRRARFAGGYYFFTVVTNRRRKLFGEELARRCLRRAIEEERERRPYEVVAFCLMPEHIHALWKLPVGDSDYSIRWSAIKGGFSREYRKELKKWWGEPHPTGADDNNRDESWGEERWGKPHPTGNAIEGVVSKSRRAKGEAGFWQRRFWEHQIRDEDDLQRHVDYIHYNPVKHGLVKSVADWPWSTYHRYVEKGFYGGVNDFKDIVELEGFGE